MKLALGTVQFGMQYGVANTGSRVASNEVAQILEEASQRGIDTLDTAISYGDSEQVLGLAGVNGWRVVGKLPAIPEDEEDVGGWAREQTGGSLARLGVAQLYGLLLHRPEQLLGPRGDELYGALLGLQEQGVVRKIGVSIYDPAELEQITRKWSFDLVQAPFNILDRRMLDSGWVDRLQALGIEVHARSIFLQGLLIMPGGSRPARFNRWQEIWETWECWLADNRLSPLEACLRYALSVPGLDKLVVGVDGIRQFREIVAVGEQLLGSTPDFPRVLDQALINPSMWSTI